MSTVSQNWTPRPRARREDVIRKHAVTEAGPADAGPALVFTHGFGSDQSAWRHVAADLARDHRVVTYDLAGAGRSDPAQFVQHRYLNLRAYAEDLAVLIEGLGLKGVVAVGHSVGAMASALAAIERPDLISRLVLLGASPHYLDEPDYPGGLTRGDVGRIYSAITSDFPQWVDGISKHFMGNADRPELAAEFARCFLAIPPENALTIACAIFQSDHRADLARVRQPTLILQSRDDPAVPPAVARFVKEAIEGSRLVDLEATGHLPHLSAPAEVTAAIREFLDGR